MSNQERLSGFQVPSRDDWGTRTQDWEPPFREGDPILPTDQQAEDPPYYEPEPPPAPGPEEGE